MRVPQWGDGRRSKRYETAVKMAQLYAKRRKAASVVRRYGADEFGTEAYLSFLDVYTELIERTLRLDRTIRTAARTCTRNARARSNAPKRKAWQPPALALLSAPSSAPAQLAPSPVVPWHCPIFVAIVRRRRDGSNRPAAW